jgi:ureidoglycolate hydrolase
MPTPLLAIPITASNFRPYGQLITATPDHKAYDVADAQLHLASGTPRFYIMRLHNRGRCFDKITRHSQCTQCLGAIANQEWFLAVAPPTPQDTPNLDHLLAFRIPGDCFVKLEVGTWHAGPYFDPDFIDFYNLELTDTNITDHHTCNLKARFDVEFEIISN